jgi:5-formyltetrahydrofolate cyclo-ligase
MGEISAEERESRSLRACHRLFECKEYLKAEIIMVFLSLPDEIDTSPLVLKSWQDRKRILAPKISWNQRRLIPIEIRSLTDDLAISQLGVREPASGAPFPIGLIDLVIVPGLAFDNYGQRLGRGRGFYDRFLAHLEYDGTSCAMALEEQVVESVPVGPHDKQVDLLVTDTEVRRFDT